jgi:hypothetical protein
MNVAALYIDPRGPYPKLLGPELCWDAERDARTYSGPWPVVAHPPCQRWGRYWSGGPSSRVRKELGADNGCFVAALEAVRKYGGVLEHPEASYAFAVFGLGRPRWRAGWQMSDDGIGKICCVAQGNYGHRARKLTWLYAKCTLWPRELDWSIPKGMQRLDAGCHSSAERQRSKPRVERLTPADNIRTPEAFAAALIDIARGIYRP